MTNKPATKRAKTKLTLPPKALKPGDPFVYFGKDKYGRMMYSGWYLRMERSRVVYEDPEELGETWFKLCPDHKAKWVCL